MDKLFANSENPDQTTHSAASDLGLHCLPITPLGSPNYNGLIGYQDVSVGYPVLLMGARI